MNTKTRVWIAVAALAPLALVAVVTLQPSATVAPVQRQEVELVRFLPRDAVTDGSVDYTANVQHALQIAEGRTLLLPPFPVQVSAAPGKKHCLLVDRGTAIVGSPGSRLVTATPAVQLLRIQNADGVRLESFALSGVGGVGQSLAHGLLQIWQCRDVVVRGVHVIDADADAIAISESENVRVENCLVERGSKAGIYLSNCTASTVANNVVRDTVGHVAPSGQMVGAGILLLSNAALTCTSNVVDGGVGVGIECGSNDLQRAPDGVAIVGNRVSDVSNPTNPATSGGIRLSNVQSERRTHVLVASNSIARCAQHGILAENNDGASITGNSIQESWMSAIVVGHALGVHVSGNTILDANVAHSNGQAGVYLHPTTSGCVVRDNAVIALTQPVVAPVVDRAAVGANSVQ